jgi:hypothetical protein
VIPLQQNNVKIVFAGGTGCYGCNVVFLCFCFDLRHPTERKKKMCRKRGPRRRIRTVPDWTDGGKCQRCNNSTKITYTRTDSARENNSCCGSCRLAWSWCGMSITTTTKTRLDWRGRFFTVLHVKNCVAACRMSRVTSL